MDADAFFWVVARVSGLASFLALGFGLTTGMALRTGVLDLLGPNRAVRSLHEFMQWLWVPLGLIHVVTLLLDRTARLSPIDLVVPFQAPYGGLAVGLGTLTLEIFALVVLTGWLKRAIPQPIWIWIHRLGYVAFAMVFFHALLGGTDFTDHTVSAVTWSAAMVVALLALARVLWGHLPQ
jgi:methionine sulfoxide reductase heme-binding subunit